MVPGENSERHPLTLGPFAGGGGASFRGRTTSSTTSPVPRQCLSFAGELLAGHRDDTCSQIILDSGPIKGTQASDSLDSGVAGSEAEENIGNLLRTRTTARRIGRAIFIVVVDKDVQSEQYGHAVDDTERILTKICAVIYDNQLMRRE